MRWLLLLIVVAAGGLWLAGGSDARPSGAVRVTLDEGTLEAGTAVVPAGQVTFETRNAGTLEHELQILRTDLAPDQLPIGLEGIHYEKAGELVLGEPHGHDSPDHERVPGHIRSGGTRRDVVRLTPGKYVLLCNLPGHYASGQRTALTVR